MEKMTKDELSFIYKRMKEWEETEGVGGLGADWDKIEKSKIIRKKIKKVA